MSKKDPAFLFYSQAFYEGTRMMLPEERACYIDLMIYQHQNGPIPLNTSRMHMYCTGVSNDLVNQVLNEKFKETDKGWVNEKMCEVVDERGKSNPKKRAYATLAGLISANSISKEQAEKIKKEFKVDQYIELPIDQLKTDIKEWFYSMVNGFVNNNKDKDEDTTKDKDETKDEKETEIKFDEVKNIFNQVCTKLPAIKKLTKQRKSAINARAKEYSLDEIGSAFKIASNSSFLNGKNDRNWLADFDWIMNPNNFIKIIEGKYNSNGDTNPGFGTNR